jgi:hypothetical protein
MQQLLLMRNEADAYRHAKSILATNHVARKSELACNSFSSRAAAAIGSAFELLSVTVGVLGACHKNIGRHDAVQLGFQ